MKPEKYILVEHIPVPVDDLMKWAKSFEGLDRQVGNEIVGKVRVSTVFLGIDHNWGDGPPLLFETMVFGGKLDGEMKRYSTWEEAEEGHKKMVARVKAAQKKER